VSVLSKPSYGIKFEVATEDFYVSEDQLSCGANIKYRHAWNEGSFKLEISLRETPSLLQVNRNVTSFRLIEMSHLPCRCSFLVLSVGV